MEFGQSVKVACAFGRMRTGRKFVPAFTRWKACATLHGLSSPHDTELYNSYRNSGSFDDGRSVYKLNGRGIFRPLRLCIR
jgi:hypothetical protein